MDLNHLKAEIYIVLILQTFLNVSVLLPVICVPESEYKAQILQLKHLCTFYYLYTRPR